MAKTFGSGQAAGGMPLDLTTSDQLLHTAVAGGGTPELIKLFALNKGSVSDTVTVTIENAGATESDAFVETISLQPGAQSILVGSSSALLLNAATTVSVKKGGATGSSIAVYAEVDDQADTTSKPETIGSGEITLVQNTDAFRTNGVASSATEADHQVIIPADGTLSLFQGKASTNIGGGATVTAVVRVNGADTALTFTYDVGDTTTLVSDAVNSVAVSAGDLVTINCATDNAGAPASTMYCSVDFLRS